MGDLSEMRGLVVVFGFLTCFVLLISTMPSQFYATTAMANTTVPTTPYSGSDLTLGNYNETWNYMMNENSSYSGHTETFPSPIGIMFVVPDVGHDVGDSFYKFGGHDIDLWYSPANSSYPLISLHHNYGEHGWFGLIGWATSHTMTWENKGKTNRGAFLSVADLQTDYAANGLPYKVTCDHLYLYASFWYNDTTYTTLTDAFNHHALYISLGINFDQQAASFDAWSLISRIVTFQAIDGVPFPVGTILAAAMWAAVGYIVFIFALRVIGAVFGGGGA